MNDLDNEFDQLLKNGYLTRQDLFELLFVLVLWKHLSESSVNVSPNSKWSDPGQEFHFGSMGGCADSNYVDFFYRSLDKWRKCNSQLNYVFYIDKSVLDQRSLFDAWKFLKFITNNSQLLETASQNELILDRIISFFRGQIPSAHEYFTPGDISKLMTSLLNKVDGSIVFDPSCGAGDLLLAALSEVSHVSKVVGIAQDSFAHKIAWIRLVVSNASFSLFNNDEDVTGERFDIIVANPPFGKMEFSKSRLTSKEHRLGWPTIRRSEAKYLIDIIEHLSSIGVGAVILPNGILSDKANYFLRKEIVENNLLEGVIHLPKGVFYNARVSTSLLILNKQKNNNQTKFIDASKLGLRSDERVQLSAEDIRLILDSYNKDGSQKKDQKIINNLKVDSNTLTDHGFDFQIVTYNSTTVGRPRRKSKDILSDCISLEAELAVIQRRIRKIISSNS
jgi:type I restriction-modification system DNA methylase subunit